MSVISDDFEFDKEIQEYRDEIGDTGIRYELVSRIPALENREEGVVYSDDSKCLLMAEYFNLWRKKNGEEPVAFSVLGLHKDPEKIPEKLKQRCEKGVSVFYNHSKINDYEFWNVPEDDNIERVFQLANISNIKLLKEMTQDDFSDKKVVKSLEGLLSHELFHSEFDSAFYELEKSAEDEGVGDFFELQDFKTIMNEGMAYGIQSLVECFEPRIPKNSYTSSFDNKPNINTKIEQKILESYNKTEKEYDEYWASLDEEDLSYKEGVTTFLSETLGVKKEWLEEEYDNLEKNIRKEINTRFEDKIRGVANLFAEHAIKVGKKAAKQDFFMEYTNYLVEYLNRDLDEHLKGKKYDLLESLKRVVKNAS